MHQVPTAPVAVAEELVVEVDPIIEAARSRIERRRNPDRAMWHTLVPRVMISFGLVCSMFLGNVAAYEALTLAESAPVHNFSPQDWLESLRWLGPAMMAFAVAYFGILWWSFAAARNIKRITPTGPGSFSTIVAFALLPTAAVDLAVVFPKAEVAIGIAYAVLALVGYLLIVGSYRRAAGRIGAAPQPWRFIQMFPLFMALAVGGVAAAGNLFPGMKGIAQIVGGVAMIGLMFSLLLNVWRGTSTLDHACRNPRGPMDPAKEEALMNNLLLFQQRNAGMMMN